MQTLFSVDYHSPIGMIEITSSEQDVLSILFVERNDVEHTFHSSLPDCLKTCYEQLDEFFHGKRKAFSFPYRLEGTDFQKNVWNALTTIPYGQTGSYKDIALSIGNEKAVRAVGSANGKNKLSIVVPCHRIIGANGTLTGYAGGLWRKEWLLNHEKTIK